MQEEKSAQRQGQQQTAPSSPMPGTGQTPVLVPQQGEIKNNDREPAAGNQSSDQATRNEDNGR